MTLLLNHFYELKLRFFYFFLSIFLTFSISLSKASILLFFLAKPFIIFTKEKSFDFIFTNIMEVLEIYLTISFCFCIFINGPTFLFSLYNFLKPGLYFYEKIFLRNCLSILIINFYISFLCTYFLIFPFSLTFILNFDILKNIDFLLIKLTPRITDYIYIFIKFLFFYSLLLFQIPIIFYIIGFRFNVKCHFFFKKRKVLILLNLLIFFIFIPTDLISWLFFILPIILFLELGIFLFTLKDCYSKK